MSAGRTNARARWRIEKFWNARQARRAYRRRFGIDSRNRGAKQARGWTTAANPAYRILLIGVSLVLQTVWVHLRWLVAQAPRRGRRQLNLSYFSLRRCVRFIVQALDRQRSMVIFFVALSTPRL